MNLKDWILILKKIICWKNYYRYGIRRGFFLLTHMDARFEVKISISISKYFYFYFIFISFSGRIIIYLYLLVLYIKHKQTWGALEVLKGWFVVLWYLEVLLYLDFGTRYFSYLDIGIHSQLFWLLCTHIFFLLYKKKCLKKNQ